jgi:hypothetical protein
MTDPNFLHAGDHVHLGPWVTGARVANPVIGLEELPRIDAVLFESLSCVSGVSFFVLPLLVGLEAVSLRPCG